MGPGNLSSSTESQLWHSLTPYAFRGLAAVMGLIAIILLASGHPQMATTSLTSKIVNPVVPDSPETELEVMVVIMAGDDNPSFLAMSSVVLSSSTSMGMNHFLAMPQTLGCLCPNCINNQE